MLVIDHRECEAGDSHISTLQLLVSVMLAMESHCFRQRGHCSKNSISPGSGK